MEFIPSFIPDVLIIIPKVFRDPRGEFLETYRSDEFAASGIDLDYIQDNHAGSKRGVLRGLHYQIRQPQGKLVRVSWGKIYDVAVDLRKNSPSFGQVVGIKLSSQNKKQIWIPPGFAHGYYVLSEWAEVSYKVTAYYAPEWERTLIWNDPDLGIEWPLLSGEHPILSENDKQGILLKEAEVYD